MKRLLDVCKRARYLDVEYFDNKIRNIKPMPMGVMLQNNLKTYWWSSEKKINVISNGNNYSITKTNLNDFDLIKSHYGNQDFHENFVKIRKSIKEVLPFGINDLLTINGDDRCCCSYFINSLTKHEMNYRIQRSKKIWWMKVR